VPLRYRELGTIELFLATSLVRCPLPVSFLATYLRGPCLLYSERHILLNIGRYIEGCICHVKGLRALMSTHGRINHMPELRFAATKKLLRVSARQIQAFKSTSSAKESLISWRARKDFGSGRTCRCRGADTAVPSTEGADALNPVRGKVRTSNYTHFCDISSPRSPLRCRGVMSADYYLMKEPDANPRSGEDWMLRRSYTLGTALL
jgi:hypothetical protein